MKIPLKMFEKDKKKNKDKKESQGMAKAAKLIVKLIVKGIKQLVAMIMTPLGLVIICGAFLLGIIVAAADAVASASGSTEMANHVSYAEDGAIQIDDESVDTILNSLYSAGVDPESIGLLADLPTGATDEQYQEAMRQYIREYYTAQVTTETINLYHKESTEDAAYGSIYIYRATGENTNDESQRQNLTYISYEQMEEYEANNNTEALNYFTIDPGGNLCVAGTTQITTETGSSEDNLSVDSANSSTTINLRTIDYKTAVAQYTTKLIFLFDLNIISQNPEFVSAFVELINDSRIEITVMDNVTTNVNTQTYTYTPMRKWVEEVPPPANAIDAEPQRIQREEAGDPVTEITRITTVTTEPSFKITKVKTWFSEQEIEYKLNTSGPNTSENTETLEDEQEPAAEEGEWKVNQSITTTDSTTTQNYVESVRGDVTFTIGEYGDGDKDLETPTFIALLETGFKIPNTETYEEPGMKLVNGANTLFYLLQQDQDLQNVETLMRYALYVYTNGQTNFGVTSLDGSLFEIQDFSTVTLGGSGLLKEYIRYWEHSSPPPTNADGTKYIIETGSAGEPVVGYGIDINTHGQEFINAGYSIEIGAEVDVEFVDAIEDRIREEYYTDIKNRTSGLNLTEYQLHALTSRAYNCGVGGAVATLRGSPSMNFVNSYNTYWNDETDNQFEEKNSNANFNHSLYTQYMSKPVTSDGEYLSGLERRRKSEWTLFQTGYYAELDQWYTDSGDILSAADQLHQAQTGWRYSTSGGLLTSGNIELAINNPNAATCCATYVSSALYLAGCFTEEQMNSFNYNSSNALYNFLTSNGWQVINSSSELQAGDVVFMDTNGGARDITHVQLYAGDGGWYNAGSDSAIQGDAPKYYDIGSQFMVALRQN